MTALADEPQRRPKRGLRARDDRNAVALFERLRHPQCAQAAAGNQQAFRRRRFGADLGAEPDNVRFALGIGLAEAEQAETLERQHLEALRGEKGLQPAVHLVGISGGHRDPPRAEAAQPIDHRLAHSTHRQAGRRAQLCQQLLVEVGAAIERQRRADHHDGVDAEPGEIFARRQDSLPRAS
jgi:hypothetical protein